MSELSKSQPQKALERLKEEFAVWRKNKSTRRERIPVRLLKEAARLCKYFPKFHIMETLRIEHKRIQEYIGESKSVNKGTEVKAIDFAVLPLPNTTKPLNHHYEIVIESREGTQIKFKLPEPPTKQMFDNLKSFL